MGFIRPMKSILVNTVTETYTLLNLHAGQRSAYGEYSRNTAILSPNFYPTPLATSPPRRIVGSDLLLRR